MSICNLCCLQALSAREAGTCLWAIVGMLQDSDMHVRTAALWALGGLGQSAKRQMDTVGSAIKEYMYGSSDRMVVAEEVWQCLAGGTVGHHFKEELRRTPYCANAHGNWAAFLENVQGDHAAAEYHYNRALTLNPNFAHAAHAHHNWGGLCRVRGDHDAAEFHYKKALEIDPKLAAAHCSYANFLTGMRCKHGAAEYHYKKARELDPNDPCTNCNYAYFLKTVMGDDKAAEDRFKEALAVDPNNANIHGNYAWFLKATGKHKAAKDHYKKALELASSDAHACYEFRKSGKGGYQDATEHDSDEALRLKPSQQQRERIAALLPDHTDLSLTWGDVTDHLKEKLQSKPNAEAHYAYATLLTEVSGDHDVADRHFQKALSLDWNHANAHYGYAILLSEVRGDHDTALRHYEEALRIDPNFATARCRYASLLVSPHSLYITSLA